MWFFCSIPLIQHGSIQIGYLERASGNRLFRRRIILDKFHLGIVVLHVQPADLFSIHTSILFNGHFPHRIIQNKSRRRFHFLYTVSSRCKIFQFDASFFIRCVGFFKCLILGFCRFKHSFVPDLEFGSCYGLVCALFCFYDLDLRWSIRDLHLCFYDRGFLILIL